MYAQFFGLKEKPFAITPDSRYLFMSERHAEALAHLMYGINEAGGFVQLTGEIGTGKTTLVRSLLEQMPQHADVAVILNPRITPHELLLSICQEVGVAIPDYATYSSKNLIDALNVHLLDAHAKGRRVIVIIDEAQNLSPETLEQVRLLTNLETASAKLLQIILIGQPELREVLASSNLRQLAQRITGRYHLEPLSRHETLAYIKHRLKIAGATGEIFSPRALREAHRVSHGVPRVINIVCDRALLGAYGEDQHRIDASFVRRAAGEVLGRTISPSWLPWAAGATAVVTLAILSVAINSLWRTPRNTAAATPIAVQPIPVPVEVTPQKNFVADVKQTFADFPTPAGTDRIFTTLLALWSAKLEPNGGRPCEQAARQGLECVYQRGSWGQLRMLNRPAILTLTDDYGTTRQVVLAKLSDESAQIDFGGGQREVTLASLSRYWLGDYLVIWRPQALGQALGQRALALGMQGREVRSLRRGLDSLHHPTASITADDLYSDYFDDDLAKQIETFQREHRLTVDGIAGVQTQIVLDSLVNAAGAPRLLIENNGETSSGRQS
ncbi:MAG TPA: AAA family ATPase [Steroidobacteraceae bacterium]|nr:AAA family ATPase [Steroidobacteraceae bacterium]